MEDRRMMIFVVLTETGTSSQVCDAKPPVIMISSSRVDKETSMELFPPFVLTYNMDIVLKQQPGFTKFA
ncbi:hypothetical protein F441_17233 [Phytophthora nicotianae CJ01A1]|uniref:Uncharacterized protein n=2 Tax=Phytophthora nicotianae TaxID=4792 RepID=W2KEA0_PHYNI|nr:hypothetical protein L915_16881 [Phytophthora nicotianae]ETL83438.1 hypothetical protein L917_16615 [Phytophthora nicotianae]ETP06375.1 hypothetical protein F441_17233 [Phytophthora nicotianae CJ01A1]